MLQNLDRHVFQIDPDARQIEFSVQMPKADPGSARVIMDRRTPPEIQRTTKIERVSGARWRLSWREALQRDQILRIDLQITSTADRTQHPIRIFRVDAPTAVQEAAHSRKRTDAEPPPSAELPSLGSLIDSYIAEGGEPSNAITLAQNELKRLERERNPLPSVGTLIDRYIGEGMSPAEALERAQAEHGA